jgi:hypothetical protein
MADMIRVLLSLETSIYISNKPYLCKRHLFGHDDHIHRMTADHQHPRSGRPLMMISRVPEIAGQM